MLDLWRDRQGIAAVLDAMMVALFYQDSRRFIHIEDRAVGWPPNTCYPVCAGRLQWLLANIEHGTMAVQPFSARSHPSLACPVRRPRPLGSPNELPAVEFSAAMLAAVVPQRRSRRTPSQPRVLLFASEPIFFLGDPNRPIAF
jgi:hypothetical protein